ncbi:MAG TPA: DUF2600 family protein [Clostridia bacterium]|nr:DUF2600 family protein [Clostridia bacterium]
MKHYGEIVPLLYKYGFKILPEAQKQLVLSQNMQELCIPSTPRAPTASEALIETPIQGTLLPILSAELPGTNKEGIISFAFALLSITGFIERYRHNKDISDEIEIRRLYNCLSCAVDPSRSSSCPMIHSIKNEPSPGSSGMDESPARSCLSDRCRLQLAVLPAYRLVAPKLKKYSQLFIDLQSYRYYPPLAGVEMLKVWSSGYLQRYRDISWWEFCAASGSLLGILVMFAAAADPEFTGEEAVLLDEACFPWLCGLDSLLASALSMRKREAEGLNFTSFYSNLKECEERIVYFAERAEKSFTNIRNGEDYIRMIKAMIGLYLTEPEAEFGMLKLAGSNILKKTSAARYTTVWRLMRISGLMRQTIREG